MAFSIPDQPSELVLTESRTMRAQTADRVDVLDKVKALSLLPDGVHATTEIVASYYEVDVEAVNSLVRRNRSELEENGLRKLTGAELREFKDATDGQTDQRLGRSGSLRLFTRRAILNVGQLLTESEVAKAVRTYLLELEAAAGPQQRSEAVDAAALGEARMRVLRLAEGIVDAAWLELKTKHVVARALGEEPDVDPLERPLYVPTFLGDKGLTRADVNSEQSWFGRRVASLYEAEHGEKPGKRTEETTRGSIRETYAWTERHRSLFEEAWTRWYAAKYPAGPIQGELGGAA